MRENLHEFRGVIKVNNNDRETSRESFSEQRLSEGIVSLYLSEYFTGLNMKNTKNDWCSLRGAHVEKWLLRENVSNSIERI